MRRVKQKYKMEQKEGCKVQQRQREGMKNRKCKKEGRQDGGGILEIQQISVTFSGRVWLQTLINQHLVVKWPPETFLPLFLKKAKTCV